MLHQLLPSSISFMIPVNPRHLLVIFAHLPARHRPSLHIPIASCQSVSHDETHNTVSFSRILWSVMTVLSKIVGSFLTVPRYVVSTCPLQHTRPRKIKHHMASLVLTSFENIVLCTSHVSLYSSPSAVHRCGATFIPTPFPSSLPAFLPSCIPPFQHSSLPSFLPSTTTPCHLLPESGLLFRIWRSLPKVSVQ